MNSFFIIFSAFAIYAVAVLLTTAVFGKGTLGLISGGLLGTVVLLGVAKSMGKK